MDMFFDIGRKCVNISKIREICVARRDALRITFDDGDTEVYSTRGRAEKVVERLGKTILQLIPCTSRLYNVYDNRDGTYYRERVDYLALCADGYVRSLASPNIFFELAEEASNFVGCFTKERLDEYPACEDLSS